MRLLAFDVSSKHVGWCLFIDGAVERYASFPLARTRYTDMPPRLLEMDRICGHLIVAWSPDAIAYEGPAHKSYPLALVQQSRVVGVLLLHAARYGLPVVEVSPAAAKAALTGNGNADKAMMITMARAELNDPVLDDDHVADALGVGIAACAKLRLTQAEDSQADSRVL
jgi:Holliday junction resolvasome RuvABC endonuclease subunit